MFNQSVSIHSKVTLINRLKCELLIQSISTVWNWKLKILSFWICSRVSKLLSTLIKNWFRNLSQCWNLSKYSNLHNLLPKICPNFTNHNFDKKCKRIECLIFITILTYGRLSIKRLDMQMCVKKKICHKKHWKHWKTKESPIKNDFLWFMLTLEWQTVSLSL